MILRRGDVVGVMDSEMDFLAKPRPALIIQASDYLEVRDTVIVCLFSSELNEEIFFRPIFNPTAGNGLESKSALQADKLFSVRKTRLSETVWGAFSVSEMKKVNRALRQILAL